MSSYADRIKPTDCHISSYLDDLRNQKYQIPTFQREIVWERDSVKKLWDSIFHFYPIGSILIWKTDLHLQNHRAIGGHVIADGNDRDEFHYILDGQQRTTALLTSLYGGKIEGKEKFDPTLYIDLTIAEEDEIDDQTFKKRFLFWEEIDDKGGTYSRNTGRMNRYRVGVIIKLRDVIENFATVFKKEYGDYSEMVTEQLLEIKDILDNYRLSLIRLKGISVPEVCEIFERINQEGQPLDIFDIVVAKTFRVADDTLPGFNLRKRIQDFRKNTRGNFADIDDLTYLQIIATIIRQVVPDAGIYNITPTYLNKIKTEHIEAVWEGSVEAILRLFDFFDNHLHLKGPRLIPNRYFYLSVASHLYNNREPNYDFLKQYFWYYSFHDDDLLTNTTHLKQHVKLLEQARIPGQAQLGRFLIDRQGLRAATYSARGRLANATLCLLANQEPRDWAISDRHVLTDVYYMLTDKPNLHHIFPLGYVQKYLEAQKSKSDSMMNIAYLTQITNLQISDKNPIQYLRNYDGKSFESVLQTHLIPLEILQWARQEYMPEDGLEQFIEGRVELIIQKLKEELPNVTFDVHDTKETADSGN